MPNMFNCMGNSDVALDGFLALNAGIGSGKLGPKNVKMIILLPSQLNDCEYCVAAHTQKALDSGLLTKEECVNARKTIGPDEKATIMLEFSAQSHIKNLYIHKRHYLHTQQDANSELIAYTPKA